MDRKFVMSRSEKMEYSPNDNNSSEDILQDNSEESGRNSTRTVTENLPFVGELASKNQCLPSLRSEKVSCQLSNQPPMPSLQAPNIDQLDETFLNTDLNSLQELRSRANYSRNEDVLISPRQHPATSSVSILEDSVASEAKTNQKDLSPFAASHNDDFASPPERSSVSVIRSLSKNLYETNTPSPEKRSVETDVESTPIKRLRKTPEIDSGKPGTETESYRSKLSFSAAVKTPYKSPTNLQIQQMKAAIQNNEESESLNTPLSPRKIEITRNYSVGSKAKNDPCLLNSISPSSTANSVHKSLTNVQMHRSKGSVQNVDESSTERKILISLRDCSTESNSLAKNSNPDGLLQSTNFLTLPAEEHESTVSNESTDASSTNPNLKTKQKDTQWPSDASGEGALPNFMSKKDDTVVYPTTLINTSIPNNVSGKQRDKLQVSDVSFEVVQPDLQLKETESAVHSLRLTDKTCSNRGPASKSQNSTTESFESCIEVKKIQNSASVSAKETQSASNESDSAIEAEILNSSQSSPIFLNPHLPSSCHLPRRSNSSVTNILNRLLEFDSSDKKVRIDQNRSDSSTRNSTPERESRSQSKELSVFRSRGIHRRSLSNTALPSKNSLELYQSSLLQETFPRSHSKESSTSCSLRMHRRSLSGETLTSRNLTEVQAQQDQSNSLIRSLSKETPISRSLPEISEGVSRTTCVVQPLFRGLPPRSTSNTTSATNNPPEFSHSSLSNQLLLGMTETLPSNESSTSRNNPELQMQQNRNDPSTSATSNLLEFLDSDRFNQLLQRMTETLPLNDYRVVFNLQQRRPARFLSGEASTSRNQPAVGSDINAPYINVFEGQASTSSYQPVIEGQASTSSYQPVIEGQASTSSYQPIITGGSPSFDQSYFPTSRNEPAEISTPCIAAFEGESSSARHQLLTTDGSSSDDQFDSSDYLSSSDTPQSGESRERTLGTFQPFTLSLHDKHPEYIVQARLLLQSVLKEIMLYNKEDYQWNQFEALFRRISESWSQLDNTNLITDLVQYFASKAYELCDRSLVIPHEMTEMYTRTIYGKLTLMVVNALTFTLTLRASRDFCGVTSNHSHFRFLCDIFSLYWDIYNVEDIEDEASRNREKTLKEMIQRLLLVVLLAFRLLLMYVGENISETYVEILECGLSGEDKMFLRRNSRYRL